MTTISDLATRAEGGPPFGPPGNIAPPEGGVRYPTLRRLLPGRRRQHEHLDRPDLPAAERAASHADLDRLAGLPGQLRPLARAILHLVRQRAAPPRRRPRVRLLELGAGTGHVGLRLARLLRRRGYEVALHLTDLRTELLPPAGAAEGLSVSVSRLDVLADALPETDIAYANLLLHHLDDEAAALLLGRMRDAARWGGAVYDLDRTALCFAVLRRLIPCLARSPVTVADSLLSVQQAFRPNEVLRLCRAAGIAAPRVTRHLWIRWCLRWGR